MHSLPIVLCVSVRWMLCTMPFASVLLKVIHEVDVVCPVGLSFPFPPYVMCVNPSLGVSGCPWFSVHRVNSGLLLKGDRGRNIYRKWNEKHQLSRVLQWYQLLPYWFYRPHSASLSLCVNGEVRLHCRVQGGSVGSCAPRADMWEYWLLGYCCQALFT